MRASNEGVKGRNRDAFAIDHLRLINGLDMVRIPRSLRIAALLSFSVVVACQRRRAPNVMELPAQCDTVPPPLARNEHLDGEIPRDVVAAADSGIVIGVVTEARSGRVLPYSNVSLFRGEGTERVMLGSEKVTDSLGGFVLGPQSPGRYTLRVRSMQHYPEERPLELRASTVDTVRVAMRYFRCTGY